MKILLDTAPHNIHVNETIAGQFLTPLTNYRLVEDMPFAIDNGAYTRFDAQAFNAVLVKCKGSMDRCLFVAMPDIVGSARRTMEVFYRWHDRIGTWPVALVAQDGIEDLPIPWDLIDAIFIGGSTEWKMSNVASDVIKAAQILGLHTHIGRVNTLSRFQYFAKMGVDTCDGSGVSRFDWMRERIEAGNLIDLDRPLLQDWTE